MNKQDKLLGQDIFLQSIEQYPDQRENFVRNACSHKPLMYQYVMDLLKAHDSANTYFDDLEDSISSTHLNEIEDHLYRDIDFGQYQIINILKQGGMGTILLARRSDGEFERTVVIKMIPIDLNFKHSQDQFAHEKEILASLSHPNIVQLYDSGITNIGHSYFVMELVKGKTLIKHCNENKLNVEQRINLFIDVLNAVGYAHQHLVIHGDIKPSNIMVNEEGQLKLMDFGIARLVNKNDGKHYGYSLNYLTPEHQGKQPIITTTDIHQLGQLLFELLTNLQPKDLRNSDFEFPLLSKAYDKMDKVTKHNLIDFQSTTKRKLLKLYNSDLQYILDRSLSVNPQNRYNTIQTFIDDLDLFASGYCVKARSPTLYYSLSKYLRRNAMLTAFFSLLLISSFAFVAITNQHNTKLALERDKGINRKEPNHRCI